MCQNSLGTKLNKFKQPYKRKLQSTFVLDQVRSKVDQRKKLLQSVNNKRCFNYCSLDINQQMHSFPNLFPLSNNKQTTCLLIERIQPFSLPLSNTFLQALLTFLSSMFLFSEILQNEVKSCVRLRRTYMNAMLGSPKQISDLTTQLT